MINASDFVSLMKPKEDSSNFKLAVVRDLSRNDSPIIQFDGEEEPSGKSYPFLESYKPEIGDRVLLVHMARTYVIIGKVQHIKENVVVVDDDFYNEEIIRTRKNLGDSAVTLRRSRPFGSPDRIYNIYVDNKMVKTAIREYYPGQQSEWTDLFEVGEGQSVAIAFDGEWDQHRNRYGLVTKENPYLFWVDLEGRLWKQIWNDTSTKVEMASNVKQVRAVRGWKNINYRDRDHGLIVGYIKENGKVYYRNYSEQADGSLVWGKEVLLDRFTGIANNFNVFITNDYRTGFAIEDNTGKIHLIISERNWAGMAIAPESISVGPTSLEIELVEMQKEIRFTEESISVAPSKLGISLQYAGKGNEFIDIYNEPITVLDENNQEIEDWGKVLIFETKHKLHNIDVGDFEIMGEDANFYPDSVDEVEVNMYKLSFLGMNSFNNAGDSPILVCNEGTTSNGAGLSYETFSKEFEALNLVPEEASIPEVKEVWNE